MFRRKIYDKMLAWKHETNGSRALLIEGPHRVGKTTIVESFAQCEYKSYIMIDFSMATRGTYELFDDMSDLNYLFLQLQLYYHTNLYERESLIVFDEVQLCPKARQAIKALVHDGRYDYIETGSLISIKKNTADILIPSEERRIQMYPMDFEEFLWAQGDDATVPLLSGAFQNLVSLGDAANRLLMRKFRLYMLVGGMPQAVDAYIATNNLQDVDAVKRDILALYDQDFYKLDKTGAVSLLFNSIPAELAKKASRYQVSSVLANRQVASISEELSNLIASRTVLPAFHVDDPNTGLAATKDLAKFKLYLCDTGLFVTLMFKDAEFVENEVYPKLLSDKLPVNLGYVYENVVAQQLAAMGNALYYHTWKNKTAHRNYEIDFILSRGNKIYPIEVKSTRYKTHLSLDVFFDRFHERIGSQYLVYTKDVRKDGAVICIPTYLASFL